MPDVVLDSKDTENKKDEVLGLVVFYEHFSIFF